jgi:hypothetical protein
MEFDDCVATKGGVLRCGRVLQVSAKMWTLVKQV